MHCTIALVLLTLQTGVSTDPPPESSLTALGGDVPLIRLIDLCAQRGSRRIEYDSKALQGIAGVVRSEELLSDSQLWALTQHLLASRGFTTVYTSHGPGSTLSVVKLIDAANVARIEKGVDGTDAGFATILYTVRHRSSKELIDAVKPLLSKPGGAVVDIDQRRMLLISDLSVRLAEILQILGQFDAPSNSILIRTIRPEFVPALQLAANVNVAVTSRNTLGTQPLIGTLSPLPDGNAVTLVVPAQELDIWLELIAQFDSQPLLETRNYVLRSFDLANISRSIEQVAREPVPRGSGDRWRVVQDPTLGSLVITATPAEHNQIVEFVDRLIQMPAESHRPIRSFAIRNRSVREVSNVISKLIAAGALDSGKIESNVTAEDASNRLRSLREILPINSGGNTPSSEVAMPERRNGNGIQAMPNDQRLFQSQNALISDEAWHALTLTTDESTNTIIAVGEPWRLNQVEQLIRTLDVRQPQVMIEVLVVSLSENNSLDLGVELQKLEFSGDTAIRLSSLFGLGSHALGATASSGFTGLVLNPGDFSVLIRALQTLNRGRALNIPKALVNNNQQATLDAVVQQPFIATNASDTVATTSFGGFENAGTTLTIKPQIAKADHLVLEYSVSISAFVGDSSLPGVPPPRQQNTLQSVVTIPDGYTVAVGGIEIATETRGTSQIPILGDVPLLGEAFKSRSHSESRSRFFVFIRPSVLRHGGFEDLKYISEQDMAIAGIEDDWPEVKPRIIQ